MALEQFATAVLIEFLWHTDIDIYFNPLDFFLHSHSTKVLYLHLYLLISEAARVLIQFMAACFVLSVRLIPDSLPSLHH